MTTDKQVIVIVDGKLVEDSGPLRTKTVTDHNLEIRLFDNVETAGGWIAESNCDNVVCASHGDPKDCQPLIETSRNPKLCVADYRSDTGDQFHAPVCALWNDPTAEAFHKVWALITRANKRRRGIDLWREVGIPLLHILNAIRIELSTLGHEGQLGPERREALINLVHRSLSAGFQVSDQKGETAVGARLKALQRRIEAYRSRIVFALAPEASDDNSLGLIQELSALITSLRSQPDLGPP